jgi:peptidoglycan-N-acetylglucosamine deacetylase
VFLEMAAFVTVLALTLLAVLLWFGAGVAYRRWMSGKLAKLCAEKRAIVLTYDDGPSGSVSAAVAEALKRNGAPATFFMIGAEAESRPAMLAQLQSDGHEIASHTQNHGNAWKTGPLAGMRDMILGQQTLARLGVKTNSFRPPFGKSTAGTLLLGLMRGIRFAFWTVDTQDSWDRRPIADILDEIASKGGGVVLMHDFDLPRRGPALEMHPAYVIEVTEAVIAFAREKDFKLMRFGDLCAPASSPAGGIR